MKTDKTNSLKGKYGKVGAPPKTVKFPSGPFTIERAVTMNPTVCELTVRKRVTAAVKGFYITGNGKNKRRVEVPVTHQYGDPIPQPKGAVGRPNYRIVPLGTPATKTPKGNTSTPVVNVTAPTPVTTTPEVTTPEVTTPVVVPAPLP